MATTGYGSTYVSGTDLVANYPAASLLVAQGIDAAGYYIGRGINAQVASVTTVLTDAGKTITMTAAGANTVTIPANSSVAYVVGTRINILNLGAGACTPTAAAGVTINGTITALATNSSAAVIKTATNTWSYVPFGSGTPTLTSGDVSSTTGSPTITTSGGNTIYAFTGSGTIVTTKAGLCESVIVGGGGGGASTTGDNTRNHGGGGAGGVYGKAQTQIYLPSGTSTITIGAGGATGNNLAFSGVASSITNAFTAVGGAGSGLQTTNYGASGRGGSNDSGVNTSPASIIQQGNPGGNAAGTAGTSDQGGGGGGGAGASGSAGTTSVGGAGGVGVASSITGSSVTYAGGGGGRRQDGSNGAGGAGGGGAAGATGTAGTVNTGGGGGPGFSAAGAGGSGIVIISVTT